MPLLAHYYLCRRGRRSHFSVVIIRAYKELIDKMRSSAEAKITLSFNRWQLEIVKIIGHQVLTSE